MMDLETVQGMMEVIMTAQMISRIVITMMTMVTTTTIMIAVSRWDSSLRVYFAQVYITECDFLTINGG